MFIILFFIILPSIFESNYHNIQLSSSLRNSTASSNNQRYSCLLPRRRIFRQHEILPTGLFLFDGYRRSSGHARFTESGRIKGPGLVRYREGTSATGPRKSLAQPRESSERRAASDFPVGPLEFSPFRDAPLAPLPLAFHTNGMHVLAALAQNRTASFQATRRCRGSGCCSLAGWLRF